MMPARRPATAIPASAGVQEVLQDTLKVLSRRTRAARAASPWALLASPPSPHAQHRRPTPPPQADPELASKICAKLPASADAQLASANLQLLRGAFPREAVLKLLQGQPQLLASSLSGWVEFFQGYGVSQQQQAAGGAWWLRLGALSDSFTAGSSAYRPCSARPARRSAARTCGGCCATARLPSWAAPPTRRAR